MKITNVEMVISAVKPEQYPAGQLPEFALAGRSNVGKSSFIRFITKRCTCTCHESMLAVSSRTRSAKRWIFRYPYPRRFISLILLFVPSIFPFE